MRACNVSTWIKEKGQQGKRKKEKGSERTNGNGIGANCWCLFLCFTQTTNRRGAGIRQQGTAANTLSVDERNFTDDQNSIISHLAINIHERAVRHIACPTLNIWTTPKRIGFEKKKKKWRGEKKVLMVEGIETVGTTNTYVQLQSFLPPSYTLSPPLFFSFSRPLLHQS